MQTGEREERGRRAFFSAEECHFSSHFQFSFSIFRECRIESIVRFPSYQTLTKLTAVKEILEVYLDLAFFRHFIGLSVDKD